MSDAWNRAERCRDLAQECRHVAAICSPTEMRDHHLQMEEHYTTLARVEELAALADTLGGERQRDFARM
jgi:hypothetical protein